MRRHTVLYALTTTSIPATVVANQTAVASISYTTTLGALQVDVTGLAADADADVTVTGPNTLTGSATPATTPPSASPPPSSPPPAPLAPSPR